jgi:acyl-coenzyme A synthetase/AMP-(fatty) acid ligase
MQGSAKLTAALLRFAAERLAPMKLPRRIEYRSALPREPNGKLRRALLSAPPRLDAAP